MSILSVNEHWDVGAREIAGKGKEYERTFFVISNTPTETEDAVLAATGLPILYNPHPRNTDLMCSELSAKRDGEARMKWLVTASYIPRGDGVKMKMSATQPWELPAEVTYGEASYSEGIDKSYYNAAFEAAMGRPASGIADDVQGLPKKPVRSSVNLPFDPVYQQDVAFLVITISRNERADDFDPDAVEPYRDTLNSAKIMVAGKTIEAYCGRMRSITATKAWTTRQNELLSTRGANANEYFKVQYVIEYVKKTHATKLLDMSLYKGRKPDGTFIPFLDSSKQPLTEPGELDGAGGLNPVGNDPVFLPFLTRWPADWSSLRLPVDK